jgi:L-alanine-DL-glutamate epimerase-like enolase superfamily enzyme
MQLTLEPFTVHKRFALTISRGTAQENTNLWLKISSDNIEGWGEASPFSLVAAQEKNTQALVEDFAQIIPLLAPFSPLERQAIAGILKTENISSSVRAAIDVALWDWLGKRANLPLWQLWGLGREKITPISVTIGISSPEAALQRVRDWQSMGDIKRLKLKLGSPGGIKADQAMVRAIRENFPNLPLMVDANGGWNLGEALEMATWLAQEKVLYIEQPLAPDAESDLGVLCLRSPLPIFLDESCLTGEDILRLPAGVAGVNLKLMKAGGLSEVRRMITLARARGLQVMFGCYSDSCLANTAMAHLSPLADYLDLDSHLNLVDDPFLGARLEEGKLIPKTLPGLGVTLLELGA